ncbi:MAG: HAD-IA family hydrolase [Firmicutes bacterium]|nr:HAD-IA family hydrolase [Bacillota bacterium]
MRDLPGFDGPMYTWPRVEALPHVKEVLVALRPDWILALATNAEASDEANIRKALARVDLDGLIEKIYCYRSIGHKKPSPYFFAYILNDLGMGPERVVMVGDDFEMDVLGANRCGIPAIWFNERAPQERRSGKMYRTIHDFRALPGELEALLSGSPV